MGSVPTWICRRRRWAHFVASHSRLQWKMKRAEAEGSRSRDGGLIRSFVLLLPLLWWALGFNSAAPVCSGIRLLPWQSHTYSHSSGILLILCPANTQRRSHMHSQRHTRILECMHEKPLSNKYWPHNCTLTHTRTEPAHTSTFFMCKHEEPEPWASADLNADLCFNHLSANSSPCWLCV